MPDTKEVILTEYKSKGFEDAVSDQKRLAAQYDKTANAQDKASGSADKLGQRINKLSTFGRNLRQAGGFLGSDTIAALGDFADGIGDTADSLNMMAEAAKKAVKEAGGLRGAFKAAAGVGLAGLGIAAAAAISEAQRKPGEADQALFERTSVFGGVAGSGRAAGLQTRAQLQQAGIIPKDVTVSEMAIQAQNAQIDARNAVFNFKEGLTKNAPVVNDIAGRTFNAIGGLFNGTGLGLGNRSNQFGQAAQDVFRQQQNMQQWQQTFARIANAQQQGQNLLQAGRTFTTQQGAAKNAYSAALYNIERETGQKRAEIARQYAQSLVDFDTQYYTERAKVAQNYDAETQRMEADHQKQMRRLAEDHQTRLRHLADSRDALAIEDEIESYKKERSRAEEDYQDQAKARSEDFARQMAEMEQAHQEQRNERQRAYQEQLRDLQIQANDRRKTEYANYQLLLGDIVTAFNNARTNFAAGVTNNNTTTNNTTTNATANVNVSGGAGISADHIRNTMYEIFADLLQ